MSSGATRGPLRGEARLPEQLTGLLAPVISAADLDLETVEVTPAGRRRLLRVVVDREGGVGLDHIATASHAISAALDDTDVMGGQPYVLEVSSPGVDRLLTAPRHWERAQGRLVRAVLAGGEVVVGRVLAADAAEASLECGTEVRILPYATVGSARVQVEFNRVAQADLGEDDAADEDDEDEDDGDGAHDTGEEGN